MLRLVIPRISISPDRICADIQTVRLLCLKIHQHHGKFTDFHLDGIYQSIAAQCRIGDRNLRPHGRGRIRTQPSLKHIIGDTADGRCGIIAFRNNVPFKIAVFIMDRPMAPRNRQAQIAFLSIVQGNGIAGKIQFVRLRDKNFHFADIDSVIFQMHGNGADIILGRRKHAGYLVDCSRGRRIQLPKRPGIRHRSGRAARIYAVGGKLHFAARRIDFVVRRKNRMVEFPGRIGRGNDEKRRGNGTFDSVAGVIHYFQAVRALFPCRDRSRTAAVEIQSVHAPGIFQHAGKLIII